MTLYSPRLRVALQETGENDGTWGNVANDAVFQLLEDALAGLVSVSVTSADVTLTTNNGTADQARAMLVEITGAPGVARAVNCPAVTKVYLVNNKTTGGQVITFKTSAGTGVSVIANQPTWVYCDGTNVVGVTTVQNATNATTAASATDALALGGFAAALYPRLAVANLFTAAQATSVVTLTPGTTVTINAALSNSFQLTPAQNFTMANPTGGTNSQTIRVVIKQDATGSRIVTWGSQFRWQGGVVPTLSTGANAVDYLSAQFYSGDTIWMAALMKGFA